MEESNPLQEVLEMLRERGVVSSGIKQSILDEYKFMRDRGQCNELVWRAAPEPSPEPSPEPEAA